jgi:hypothetical protein
MTETIRPRIPGIKLNFKIPRPVRLDVLEAATAVPGKALALLIGIWLLVVLRQSPTVPLSRRTMQRVAVSVEPGACPSRLPAWVMLPPSFKISVAAERRRSWILRSTMSARFSTRLQAFSGDTK